MKSTIIVPAAGSGIRLKSFGPKSLFNLGKERVLERNLRQLKNKFPDFEIIVILGHEVKMIKKIIPSGIRTIYNRYYDETNVAFSISLGIEGAAHDNILCVYGDLVYNDKTLNGWPLGLSFCVADKTEQFDRDEIGIKLNDGGNVNYFSYSEELKWCHIFGLSAKDTQRYLDYVDEKIFSFEVFNKMLIKDELNMDVITPKRMKIIEIDRPEDIEKTKKIIGKK